MEVKELRVGNIIKYKESLSHGSEILHEVVGFNKPVFSKEETIFTTNGQGSVNAFEPIPLTEEWLVKFGFERIGDMFLFPNHVDFCIYKTKAGFNYGYRIDSGTTRFYKRVKHVHQLQNLYFALTGEELINKH